MKLIIEIPNEMYECVQNGTYCGTLYEELKNGTPLEESEDCVSFEAVKNTMLMVQRTAFISDNEFSRTLGLLTKLPPVTPAEQVGHWEWVQYDSNPNIGNWHCSECRTIIPHMPENTDNTPIYKWCPMCGSRMM